MNQVWAVFADSLDRTLGNEDMLCYTLAEAKRHMKELREDGNEPIAKAFESEDAFDAWKAKK